MEYLASPYWHTDPVVRHARAIAAAKAAHWLIANGQPAFSPIAHGYFVEEAKGEPIEPATWIAHGLAMLRGATAMFVLTLDGWRESKGVATELAEAKRLRIGVWLMSPVTYERVKVDE